MYFPYVNEGGGFRENTTVFGGINRQISASEGQFVDMANMTSQFYPVLSPRHKRSVIKQLTRPQGILDKEDLVWVDDGKLYINDEEKKLEGVTITGRTPKAMSKMGAYIIIMPDKIWYNTVSGDCGYLGAKSTSAGFLVTFSLCDVTGKNIEYHDAAYYEETPPADGDYMMTTNETGKPSLKVYSAATQIWLTIASTYIKISFNGAGAGFFVDDGITITSNSNKGLEYVLVNKGDAYSVSTYVVEKSEDNNSITIPGIFNGTPSESIELVIERKVPMLEYVTECSNRLWGCSSDGREIYCSKLGDVKNWNVFKGMSTDSWSATVGSDGKFTGAITYLGYPMFFKEDSVLKIGISSAGAHQVRETKCRGVQSGSDRSLVIINEVLYYKSSSGVCAYNGGLPSRISDDLGNEKYYDAVAGGVGDKYYISMRDAKNKYALYVYDTKTGIWTKEDNTQAMYFCSHVDELYYIDSQDNKLKSVSGTTLFDSDEITIEDDVKWFAESVPIGYSMPDQKYISRITMRATVGQHSELNLYIQYDSIGEWNHVINICGKGTKSFSIPFIPRRCDHFKYRISGKGDVKIHSLTKTIEEGSDV